MANSWPDNIAWENFVLGRENNLPEPGYMTLLKLNGISGAGNTRLAMNNTHTLAANDQIGIKLNDRTVAVRCVEIRANSAIIQVGPFRKELALAND